MEQVADDPKINEALELLSRSARERRGQLQKAINEKYADIKDVMGSATGREQQNPWGYVAGFAALFLMLGFILGRRRR
jgi:LPXTG-motif cell wall-anchored protein